MPYLILSYLIILILSYQSCLILSVVSYLISLILSYLTNLILSCLILSYLVLSCLILSYLVLSCLILSVVENHTLKLQPKDYLPLNKIIVWCFVPNVYAHLARNTIHRSLYTVPSETLSSRSVIVPLILT